MKNIKLSLLVASICLAACFSLEKGYAEEQGRAYAKELGMENSKVNCVNSDTDGDGYVSCTVATPGRDGGKPDLQPIECAAYKDGCSRNSGCRVPKNRIVTGE